MSIPSATAGDELLPSASRPSTESRQRVSRGGSKPLVTMAFNANERLDSTGLKALGPQGENSNYHHWSFVMGTVIKGTLFGYVLKDVQPIPLPPSDEKARCKVSALILRYVDQSNIKYLSPFPDDPYWWRVEGGTIKKGKVAKEISQYLSENGFQNIRLSKYV
ncbi:hypothetical protein DFH28DRAFT_1123920 [Melampsora americana]|nr:hypothetical protein DFH28DRAFT_1123920 [Melampsora americana]